MLTRLFGVAAIAWLLATIPACRASRDNAGTPPARRDISTITKPVSFALLEDYDKGDELWRVAADFVLMRELGVLTWRGSFGWDDFEPSPGAYDFDWVDQFAALAARYGITLRPYVAYTPTWAAAGGSDHETWNDPPSSVDLWASFVNRLGRVLQRHANVVSLEIYNEQNVRQWWDGSVAAYTRVLDRSLDVQTRYVPKLPFFPGGLVFPDAEWIETVCGGLGARTGDIERLAFHAYPETWTPSDIFVENYLAEGYRAFLANADRACGPKSIWINEAGFATTPGRTEDDQADWWARAIATFLAEPRIEHIGIYEIKDLPLDQRAIGDAPNYHFGLTRLDGSKKKAFYTIDMLTDLLDTGFLTVADDDLAVESRDPGADIRRHLFVRPDGRQVAFVWTIGPAVTVNVRFVRGAGDVSEYLLDGWHGPTQVRGDGVLEGLRLETKRPRVFVAEP